MYKYQVGMSNTVAPENAQTPVGSSLADELLLKNNAKRVQCQYLRTASHCLHETPESSVVVASFD